MITIKIKENSKQAKAIISYLHTLPFIEFVDAPEVIKKMAPKVSKNVPNALSLKVMSDTDKGLDLTRTKDTKDLMEKLFS